MKILECSSKGDKRYSAFYAKTTVFGKNDSIENHHQLSKRFGNSVPSTWRDSKGKKATHFNINSKDIDVKHLSSFYKLLWCKYLDEHPELVQYAKQFDDYSDMFKGSSVNCQADAIRQYVKDGRESVIKDCQEFIKLF